MSRTLATAFAIALTACTQPGSGTTRTTGRPIVASDVRRHVVELASDPYEGRGAGYPGEEKAAAYIAAEFGRIGLRPEGEVSGSGRSFSQRFQFHPRGPELPGQVLTSRNVLGFLEGDDEKLRSDIVVLGAHHDGQGRAGQADADRYPAKGGPADDDIWNSADDNASSVAALIEVARAIVNEGAVHHRSLMFVTFGAEEHALNGSVKYVTDPPFPLERHVAMVNLEKLGRAPEQQLAAAATGTCACWSEVLSTANASTGWKVASAIEDLVPDTDHYPFAARGVPAIVLGTVHEEDTHRPSDSADKIDFQALAARARYAQAVVLELANMPIAPQFAGDRTKDLGMIPVLASESELRLDGLAPGSRALKVSGVIPGLPAADAGLAPGDVIEGIDGVPLVKDADRDAVQHASDAASGAIRLDVVRNGRREVIPIRSGRRGLQ